MNFKLIKSKEFSFTDNNQKEVKGTVYTMAHKGRVFNASSLDFDKGDIIVKDNTIGFNCKIEVIKEAYTNGLGEVVAGLKIKPELGLVLAQF